MFNESFSIRALLGLPLERHSLPPGLALALLAPPVRPVARHAAVCGDDALPPMLAPLANMLRPGSSDDASAFSACVATTHETDGMARPAMLSNGLRRTRAAEILARIHDSPVGRRFTFAELKHMLPPGARVHSAVGKMLEFGFLVRLERGVYERTATRYPDDDRAGEAGAFAGLKLFIVRCS